MNKWWHRHFKKVSMNFKTKLPQHYAGKQDKDKKIATTSKASTREKEMKTKGKPPRRKQVQSNTYKKLLKIQTEIRKKTKIDMKTNKMKTISLLYVL